MSKLRLLKLCLLFSLAIVLSSGKVFAQASDAGKAADKTLLEVEILTPAIGTNPLLPQQWRKVFEEVGESVRIRQPLPNDRPKIDEQSRGPFRIVRIVGELDRSGTLNFPGKSFKQDQVHELAEFLNELKIYGAQGSPVGKPIWGLSKEQFEFVFNQLTGVVAEPVKGKTFAEALKLVPLKELQLAYHSSAEERARHASEVIVEQELKGLTAGTSLSYLLSQQGMGYRPLRTAGGGIQLMVYPLEDAPDAWPVGWPLPEDRRRDLAVPGIFKKLQTGVNESPLQTVLDVIETQCGTHLLLDRRACLAKGLDAETLQVSYPRKNTAWVLIISHVVVNSHMTMHYRQDEAQTGFIFINPFAQYQPRSATEKPVEGGKKPLEP